MRNNDTGNITRKVVFALVKVVVNDAVTGDAITNKQMNSFLKCIHDDNCYPVTPSLMGKRELQNGKHARYTEAIKRTRPVKTGYEKKKEEMKNE